MSDYTRIYLQPECCVDPDVGRCWCPDDGPQDCPEGATWTPYILASEYDLLQAENEALRQELSSAGTRIKGLMATNDMTRAENEALRARVAELDNWRAAAFDAHPNIDIDIERQSEGGPE